MALSDSWLARFPWSPFSNGENVRVSDKRTIEENFDNRVSNSVNNEEIFEIFGDMVVETWKQGLLT